MNQTKHTPQPLDDDSLGQTTGGFLFLDGLLQSNSTQNQLQKMRCLVCAKTVYVPVGTTYCSCGSPLQKPDEDERDTAFLV